MSFSINGNKVIDSKGGVIFKHQTIIADDNVNNTQTKIIANDNALDDRFGQSVAVGSGRIVVGSYFDDDNGSDSGSAYIFDLNGNQLAKIKASDAAAGDYFGYSVAVGSGRIVVGSDQDDDLGSTSGSAYIFDLNGNQLGKITGSVGQHDVGDRFGFDVAIGSGRIVVGAPFDDNIINGNYITGTGSAYIFDLNGTQIAKVIASDPAASDRFGISVAVGCGRIVVGSHQDDDRGTSSGSAYIFDLNGNQLAKITASDGQGADLFGWSVAVGSGRIVVGAYLHDSNGLSNSGAAYIFDLNGTEIAKIVASDPAQEDRFGWSVAVGSGRIVIGSDGDDDGSTLNSGSAFIFDLNGNQLAKIKANDLFVGDAFGTAVAIGSGRIAVGAPLDDDNGSASGSAYIFNIGDSQEKTFEEILEGFGKV